MDVVGVRERLPPGELEHAAPGLDSGPLPEPRPVGARVGRRGAPKSGAPGWGAGELQNFGGAEIQNCFPFSLSTLSRTRLLELV